MIPSIPDQASSIRCHCIFFLPIYIKGWRCLYYCFQCLRTAAALSFFLSTICQRTISWRLRFRKRVQRYNLFPIPQELSQLFFKKMWNLWKIRRKWAYLKVITDNSKGLKCDFQVPARNRDGEPKRRKRLSVQERMLKRWPENGEASVIFRH